MIGHAVIYTVILVVATGCAVDEAPTAIDAPRTEAAQLEALQSALEDAESKGDWVRLEVLLESLATLENDVVTHRTALRTVRRYRRYRRVLDEAERALTIDAWRTAQRELQRLEREILPAIDRARYDDLLEYAAEIQSELTE